MTETSVNKIHLLAYDKLRTALLVGQFRPGDKISLRKLASEFGLGLTPTRDAIRRIVAENALETSASGTVRVPVIRRIDLDEIMLARIPLESAAAALAARRITADGLDTLVKLEEYKLAAQQSGDLPSALRNNLAFHFAIYSAADAPLLRSLIDQLWLRMGGLLRIYAERRTQREMGDGAGLHSALVKALRDRNEDAARASMAKDIEYVGDWLRLNAID